MEVVNFENLWDHAYIEDLLSKVNNREAALLTNTLNFITYHAVSEDEFSKAQISKGSLDDMVRKCSKHKSVSFIVSYREYEKIKMYRLATCC